MALVIFLRGVNVGGHRTFRPSLLAGQLKDYGVVNIGAAGTFVVSERVSQATLRAELLRLLPFETHAMICTGPELIAAMSQAPFDGKPTGPEIVRFVSVLEKRPATLPAMPIQLPGEGNWLLQVRSSQGKFIFGQYRREMKAIGYLGTLDKLFGAPVTTRNWNTMNAIVKLLQNG